MRTRGELIAIEETALLMTLHTTGAAQTEHRARAQAAYDERMDLAIKTFLADAEESESIDLGVRQ